MIWENIKSINSTEEDEVPFGGISKDVLIDFKCKKCGYEEKVPDFVAFECYTPDEYDKESGSPIVLCIKCDSDMIIKR
jgi:hypothetical protein